MKDMLFLVKIDKCPLLKVKIEKITPCKQHSSKPYISKFFENRMH